ncbi:Maf family protein [Clostridium cylindrosporum]|uniref:dTTP/UTP pyrophosphatase n=1 Tax=Clostridium cylindrosporum DSM 605 TaxID=1121307 RepID=A0A0J8D613_CLOCY|nr:Maf family protein [Clostridium cylindrosporum]KMT21535.1 Maf-like protein [Clostridium cylindrosporum DSM 605]
MDIILASASSRRRDILKMFNLDFKVEPSNIDESISIDDPYELVEKLAYDKAMNISYNKPNSLVIGADTIVYSNGTILGKPKSKDEAFKMLKSLSGREHFVITGVSLICKDKNISMKDHEVTKVYFKNLSDDEILSYIETGDPLDKAGSYGIQGMASAFVEKIEGCYFNVVGLPTSKVYSLLGRIGVNLLERKF